MSACSRRNSTIFNSENPASISLPTRATKSSVMLSRRAEGRSCRRSGRRRRAGSTRTSRSGPWGGLARLSEEPCWPRRMALAHNGAMRNALKLCRTFLNLLPDFDRNDRVTRSNRAVKRTLAQRLMGVLDEQQLVGVSSMKSSTDSLLRLIVRSLWCCRRGKSTDGLAGSGNEKSAVHRSLAIIGT
jgi:hypothetical protein